MNGILDCCSGVSAPCPQKNLVNVAGLLVITAIVLYLCAYQSVWPREVGVLTAVAIVASAFAICCVRKVRYPVHSQKANTLQTFQHIPDSEVLNLLRKGAASLLACDRNKIGFDFAMAQFLFSIKYATHSFNKSGTADTAYTVTPEKHISAFKYVITRIFHLDILQNESPNTSIKTIIQETMERFLQGTNINGQGVGLPELLILPFICRDHMYLIFLERDDKGAHHLSIIDSLGGVGSAYAQNIAQDAVIEALKNQFGSKISVKIHSIPSQNNNMLCGVHAQMNVEEAVRLCLDNRKVFHALQTDKTVFKSKSNEELLAYFDGDRITTEEWWSVHKGIFFDKVCAHEILY